MVKIIEEYPFIDEEGNKRKDLIKHYSIDDETNERYLILQKETSFEYFEAVDIYPCPYHYKTTEHKVDFDATNEENTEEII